MTGGQDSDGSDERAPLVIGLEMARANDAEAAHREAHPGIGSPLADLAYDRWVGELDLARFSPNATDEAIRERLETWDSAGVGADLRVALTTDDFYTLLAFAQRMTVSSLREDSPDFAAAGVLALPLVACDRVDWRDLSVAVAMVAWALRRTRHSVRDVLLGAAGSADEQAAGILARHADDPPTSLREWGYEIIETPAGRGLAHTGYEPYTPSIDLVPVALTLAEALDTDRYLADRITVASDLPDVWCRGPHHEPAKAAIGRMRACLTVGADPRPGTGGSPLTQMLAFWIAEMADDTDARIVTQAALAASRDHARLAIHHGTLCSLAVARSVQVGVSPLEDQTTIQRFMPSLEAALQASAS